MALVGVRPGAVIGHSVGEIAAAVAAGVLGAEDGARVVCRRSRLLREVRGLGAMVMVPWPFDEARDRLKDEHRLCAAVAASPYASVVAGDRAAVDAAVARWLAEGIAVRRVDSDVAFHSPHMDPLAATLAAALTDLDVRQADVPLYSTALQDPRCLAPRDSAYWATNLRAPVRFAQAVTAAHDDGHRTFLEISAHPVVSHSIDETVPTGVLTAHSLRRDHDEIRTMLDNAGRLHSHGLPLDWTALHPEPGLADLPTYAWQHEHHWADPPPVDRKDHDPATHTLLGGETAVRGVPPAVLWRTILERSTRPFPGDHPVRGVEIVPAAVLLNTLLTASDTGCLGQVELRVPVTTEPPREIQVVRQAGALTLSSRTGQQGWLTHCLARTAERPAHPPATPSGRAGEPLDPGSVVRRLAELEVAAMGFPWRIGELRRDGPVTTARVHDVGGLAGALDAALSLASLCGGGGAGLRMPARIERVAVFAAPADEVTISVRPAGDEADAHLVDLDIHGVASLSLVRFASPEPALTEPLAFEPVWTPLEVTPADPAELPADALVKPTTAARTRPCWRCSKRWRPGTRSGASPTARSRHAPRGSSRTPPCGGWPESPPPSAPSAGAASSTCRNSPPARTSPCSPGCWRTRRARTSW